MPKQTPRICKQCGEKKFIGTSNEDSDFTLDKRKNVFWWTCKSCDCKNRTDRHRRKNAESSYKSVAKNKSTSERNKKETIIQTVSALCNISHHDPRKLRRQGQDNGAYFLHRYPDFEQDLKKFNISFDYIYKLAQKKLHKVLGITYPRDVQFGDGLYLVVGDSFGKESRTSTFKLIQNMQKFYNFKKIIHIGHMLDEEDDYSWFFDRIPEIYSNLVVLARDEEIRELVKKNEENPIKFNIVRKSLWLGNLKVMNQDSFNITRYTTSGIKNANSSIFMDHTMFDDTKHEMHSITTPEHKHRLFMSPGCMCIPFTRMTKVTTESPEDGEKILRKRIAFSDTHQMNRHRNQMKEFWEQGCYIISVVNGTFTPYPLRIHTLEWEYDPDDDSQHPMNQAVGLFGTVVTSNGVMKADSTTLIVGDTHAPSHDPKVLACIDSLTKIHKFDNLVNVGDHCAFDSVNHHNMSKGKVSKTANEDFVYDVGISEYLLKQMTDWAPNRWLMSANHERFIQDFYEMYPQFKSLMDIRSLFKLNENGYQMVPYQKDINIGGSTYHHGNVKGYGCSGSVHEKIAKIFEGRDMQVFIGHIHYPAIRYGCYSVGLTGMLDQGYNEVNASQWMAGVGSATSYKGIAWNTTIPIFFHTINLPGYLHGKIMQIKDPVSLKFESPETLDVTFKLQCRRSK